MSRKKNLISSLLGLILAFSSENVHAQSSSNEEKETAKLIIESFCQNFYNSCFSGRTYVENSLSVTRVEPASLNQIKVYGFHSYKGRLNTLYSDYEFQAYVKVASTSVTIKFHKKSAPDFFHSDYYWEECEKTIHMDD